MWQIVCLCLISVGVICEALAEPNVTCIDNENEFKSYSWVYRPKFPDMEHYETSDDLPPIFQGHAGLEGNGIFLIQPNRTGYDWYGIWGSKLSSDLPLPIFVYLSYYGHIQSPSAGKFLAVHPAKFPDLENFQFVPSTNGTWTWNHVLVEVDQVHPYFPSFYAQNYDVGDYVLIDKIALTQGLPIGGIDDVITTCGWSSDSLTTTATDLPTESPTTAASDSPTDVPTDSPTTHKPPGDFECPGVGSFPDPKDCTKFHVCQEDAEGDLWDSEFTCPDTTVWCQRTLECEKPDICPCQVN